MKIFFMLSLLAVLVTPIFLNSLKAKPISEEQKQKLQNLKSSDLKKQMHKMILSVADLDILVNRDQVLDYEIFIQDAERILKAISEIRKIDKENIFSKLLDELEEPTRLLKKLAEEKNPKASEMPKQIFNACFKCHNANRD